MGDWRIFAIVLAVGFAPLFVAMAMKNRGYAHWRRIVLGSVALDFCMAAVFVFSLAKQFGLIS